MKHLSLGLAVCTLALAAACSPTPPPAAPPLDESAATAAAIRAKDEEWSKSACPVRGKV